MAVNKFVKGDLLMKSSAKRLLAVLIVLAMALSLVPVMAFAAGTTTTVYCQAPSGWSTCKAYWWGSKTGTNPAWPGVNMTKGEDGIWTYDVPSDATGLIFTNGSGSQTADLKVPTDEKTMYVFQNRVWAVPVLVEIEEAYYVAGSAGLCGVEWDPGAAANKMADADKDGIYTITYTNVAAGNYEFKVTDGTWDNSWGQNGGNANYKLTVAEAGTTVEIRFNLNTKQPEAVINGLEPDPPAPLPTGFFVAGTMNGWNQQDAAYLMTEVDGIYTITFAVTAGNHALKVTDGTWDNSWGGDGADGNYEFIMEADGEITVTFDGTTVTVIGGVVPEPSPEPDPEPVAGPYYVAGDFNSWNEKDEAYLMAEADGIYTITFAVAAGNHELKVTNGTWEHAWGKDGGNYGFYKAADGEITVTFDGTTVTVDGTDLPPVEEKDYCLVGWINGADYGCNDNWETVGEYIFVDGTLTATFTEDSYIFVKSTDNANWYLANAYTEDTSATFVLGGSEKMKVPGGVELTFSLVVNEDGSVTVSYEAAEPVLGATVSGAVVSGVAGDVTIELIADGETVASVTAAGKEGTYSIENVAAGTYTLKVSQANHVAREYTITVEAEDIAQDVKIHLIGDIDGNGKINMGDVSKLNAHLKGTNVITDEYQLLCANVNGGKLNMGDTASLYSHIKGTKLLY